LAHLAGLSETISRLVRPKRTKAPHALNLGGFENRKCLVPARFSDGSITQHHSAHLFSSLQRASRKSSMEARHDRRCIVYDVGFVLIVLRAGRNAIVFD